MWDDIGLILYFSFIILLLPILIPIYIICGILDLTYQSRHKKDIDKTAAANCPYFIEGIHEHESDNKK